MIKQFYLSWRTCLFALLLAGAVGCKENEEVASVAYNPDLPVTVTSFMPEKGRVNTQMIIYGSNFGNDTAKIDVKIGGKDALVLNAKGDCLYCFVPEKSGGKIEVKVGDSEPAVSEKEFKYEYKQLVSTLCGYVDDLGYGKVLPEGSFDELEKLEALCWLSFDPQNKHILYCSQDIGNNTKKGILKFDLQERYMSTVFRCANNGLTRLLTLDWTKEGDMVVSTPNTAQNQDVIGGVLLKRSEDFGTRNILVKLPQCNSVMYNPHADQVFYSNYTDGTLYAYDFRQYGLGNNWEYQRHLFQFNDALTARMMIKHPTNKYMYVILPGKNAIMRADYIPETKSYANPYTVCGGSGSGYADLVGVNAKMNSPWQGVFVYNPEYEGQEDEYDFYFCDRNNHCIRKLTPQGIVSTFAGRGSRNLNSAFNGYVDGDLRDDARFDYPQGIAYDEENKVFYVSDTRNFRIRKIAYEDGYVPESEEEGNEENNNQKINRK